MTPVLRDRYDVVVIGAGVGGLVCACTLVLGGLRVLVVEKEPVAGGCCASFRRGGFQFDAGITAYGGCGPGRPLHKVLERLGVWQELDLRWPAPREVVSGPGQPGVPLGPTLEDSREALLRAFPRSAAGLQGLFAFLDGQRTPLLEHATFGAVLERLELEPAAHATIGILLGNLGGPPDRVSAASARSLLRDFALGSAAYPAGGVRSLARVLARRLQDGGGELLAGRAVRRIAVAGNHAVGVEIAEAGLIEAGAVVSNADARHTLLELVGAELLPASYVSALRKMEPSVSAFLVHLGLDCRLRELTGHDANLLHRCTDDLETLFTAATRDVAEGSYDDYVYALAPSTADATLAPRGGESVTLLRLTSFRPAGYSEAERRDLAERIVLAAETAIPGLERHITVQATSTPHTVARYTGNFRGAAYGWASTPAQSGARRLARHTPIQNLHLVGHWTQPGPGVAMVAQSGYHLARALLYRPPRTA